jgi:pyruvate,orthophosphate dikinase
MDGGKAPEGLDDEVSEHLAALEQARGKRLGDPGDPLLVSVRSAAKFSMPGMMETVLNVGLNDESVKGLAQVAGGDERFAYDSCRRLLQMFAEALDALKAERGSDDDLDLTAEGLRGLIETYEGLISEHGGRDFPQDPRESSLSRTARHARLGEQQRRLSLG